MGTMPSNAGKISLLLSENGTKWYQEKNIMDDVVDSVTLPDYLEI